MIRPDTIGQGKILQDRTGPDAILQDMKAQTAGQDLARVCPGTCDGSEV